MTGATLLLLAIVSTFGGLVVAGALGAAIGNSNCLLGVVRHSRAKQ